jgi:16S rRNA (uracil1498-N3)-methyltransferase
VLRLFVPTSQTEGARVRIVGTELRHLRTLRLGPGDHLCVFDEEGAEHEVRLERLGGRLAEAVVLATHRPQRDSPLDLVLASALLKGSKMDLVVEKATELGVTRIAPFTSRHTIGAGVRLDRWRRIAVAAAKQCGRTRVPAIDAPVAFATLVRGPWPGIALLAWEEERERSLAALPATAAAVLAIVGPEGGFARTEVQEARAHGVETVALAPRILRAETAAVVAAALCQHRWGDLGSLSSTSHLG